NSARSPRRTMMSREGTRLAGLLPMSASPVDAPRTGAAGEDPTRYRRPRGSEDRTRDTACRVPAAVGAVASAPPAQVRPRARRGAPRDERVLGLQKHSVGPPVSSLKFVHTTNDFRMITTSLPLPSGKPAGGVLFPYQRL